MLENFELFTLIILITIMISGNIIIWFIYNIIKVPIYDFLIKKYVSTA